MRLSAKWNTRLYIDDLRIYAASQGKLKVVTIDARMAMKDIGLAWNERKVRDGSREAWQAWDVESSIREADVIESLKEGSQYKFLGVLENVNHKDNLQNAEKVYVESLSVIWPSPLSDYNKVLATNQFALPALTYFPWTQVWTIAEWPRLDRETRKVMVANGAKHPLGSTDLLYLTRTLGRRGLKSIEREHKTIKIKAAMNSYSNNESNYAPGEAVREEGGSYKAQIPDKGCWELCTTAGTTIRVAVPTTIWVTETGDVLDRKKISGWIKKVNQSRGCAEIESERWQGKSIAERWRDEDMDEECFAWLSDWKTASMAGLQELYQQLLPTKLYASRKAKTNACRKAQESVAHVVSGCSALVLTLYLARHNAALKILFFEMLRGYQLAGRHRILVFTTPAQTCVPRRQGDGVLGCACFRGALASKSQ